MVKYRIVVDRSQCISCGAAPAVCPEVYELGADDQKNKVVDMYSLKATEEQSVGEVTEELLECAKRGAEVCPVGAIRIERVGDRSGGLREA